MGGPTSSDGAAGRPGAAVGGVGRRFPPPALILLLVAAAGCAPYPGESGPAGIASPAVVHRVQRGETLWSVAQRYGVSVDALVRENRISDITRVKVGQRLMIPSRRGVAAGASGSATTRFGAEPPAIQPPVEVSAGEPVRVGAQEEFAWPVQGKVIAIFGTRWRGRVNKGIDVQARAGTEVRATRSGKVSFVHEGLPGFGKTIILEHAEGFASVYAYVGEILVRQDEWVNQRQVIARVGETGRAQVPALHFEIRRNQKAQNPLHYLP